MSLIKVVPYVVGVTPEVPGAPEPRMYPRSGYFLVKTKVAYRIFAIMYKTPSIIRPSWIEDAPKALKMLEKNQFYVYKIDQKVLKINIWASYNSETTVIWF